MDKHNLQPYADPVQRVHRAPPVAVGRGWGEVLIFLHFITAVVIFFGLFISGKDIVSSLLGSVVYFLLITIVYIMTASGALQSIWYDWQVGKTERYRIRAMQDVKELEMKLQYRQRQLPPLGQRNWVPPYSDQDDDE